MRETGLRQMPDAPHQPGVRLRRALLAVEGRLIRLEGARLRAARQIMART